MSNANAAGVNALTAQPNAALSMTQLTSLNLSRVWVIMRDNHGDGLGEPFAAYRDKLSAERAIKLLGNAEGTFRCVEIEVW